MKTKHVSMDGFHFRIPRNRVLVDVWDGEPVTRLMTVYERFASMQKSQGKKPIDEETFNLGLHLLGNIHGMKIINSLASKK